MKRWAFVLALMLILVTFTAGSGGNVVWREQFRLGEGEYIDSFRLNNGVVYLRLAPDRGTLYLDLIQDGTVSNLDSSILSVDAAEHFAVNACDHDIYVFVSYASGDIHLIHWRLEDGLTECRKVTIYLPFAGEQ